ncbi:MAG: Regulator of sigma-E protease RseP [candidate division TA06 bacterium ADurb.Bin417]|uniref:Regulator of sigma-E protease RseP n=1 Tax=candidate division TA06 bacterium ADurb.Bin417 TaxID=1852828 RepID=A0A1V5MF51_UNCT6|nr:MAG: Regulator of sigma-E protease RseP [candidate division TA06 bacterium ADurb.Bin417]
MAGVPVKDWPSLSGEIHRYPDREISLEVDRAGRVFQVRVTPRAETLEAGQGSRRIGLVGIGPQIQREKYGLFAALGRAGKATAGVVHDIFYYLGRIFTRKMSGRDLAGPLGIAQLSTRFFRLGWSNFLYFLALLSVNLAVVNLFPLPVFDGGHLFGVMLERISGRKPSPRFIEVGQMIGLGLVLALAVFVTYNDLLRIIVGR